MGVVSNETRLLIHEIHVGVHANEQARFRYAHMAACVCLCVIGQHGGLMTGDQGFRSVVC